MDNTFYPWQQSPWQRLQQARQAGRLPHALLLTGAAGLGKRELAKNFVKSLYCLQPDEQRLPCNICPICQQFDSGALPDTHEISPEEEGNSKKGAKKTLQIGIDRIRPLLDFLSLSSVKQQYRSIIIHPADDMTPAAMNALLKTLEEPPGNALILLVTSHPRRLLPTIRSRCQYVYFSTPRTIQALEWLSAQAPNVDDKEKNRALILANNAPLKAQQWLDKTSPQSLNALNDAILNVLLRKKSPLSLGQVYEKKEITGLLEVFSLLLLDVLKYQCLMLARPPLANEQVQPPRQAEKAPYYMDEETIKKLSRLMAIPCLWRGLEKIKSHKKNASIALNKRLFLDDVCIELTRS